MEFNKKEIENIKTLLDTLVGMIGTPEPDEQETINKMYAFLEELAKI